MKRREPVEVDAVRWLGNNLEDIEEIVGRVRVSPIGFDQDTDELVISSPDGSTTRARPGDWVVREARSGLDVDEIVAAYKNDGRSESTHWDDCHLTHPRCAVFVLARELDRLRRVIPPSIHRLSDESFRSAYEPVG